MDNLCVQNMCYLNSQSQKVMDIMVSMEKFSSLPRFQHNSL